MSSDFRKWFLKQHDKNADAAKPYGAAGKKHALSIPEKQAPSSVTAVGHAAILAFIQRYVPSMIPSTYALEWLDLLRQLEKVKEMEVAEGSSKDMAEAGSFER